MTIFDFQLETVYLFLTYKSPLYFLQSFESINFSVQEKKRIIVFQDASHGCYPVFPTGMILALFFFI